jgi:hypothetical protein
MKKMKKYFNLIPSIINLIYQMKKKYLKIMKFKLYLINKNKMKKKKF